MQLQKKKSSGDMGRRAWNVLRLTLLWARKGGVFKNRFMMDTLLIRLPKCLKSLRTHSTARGGALHYGERQLSFDDTPVIHVKMHRPSSLRFKMPHIPCINPHNIDFDYDFRSIPNDDDDDVLCHGYDNEDTVRKSFLTAGPEDNIDAQENNNDDYGIVICGQESTAINGACDECIDLKAEEFIAKFYEQIKLQRQISYLRYNETPC